MIWLLLLLIPPRTWTVDGDTFVQAGEYAAVAGVAAAHQLCSVYGWEKGFNPPNVPVFP